MIEATVAVNNPGFVSAHLASSCERAQSGARVLDAFSAADHLITLFRKLGRSTFSGLNLRIMRHLDKLVAKIVSITIN